MMPELHACSAVPMREPATCRASSFKVRCFFPGQPLLMCDRFSKEVSPRTLRHGFERHPGCVLKLVSGKLFVARRYPHVLIHRCGEPSWGVHGMFGRWSQQSRAKIYSASSYRGKMYRSAAGKPRLLRVEAFGRGQPSWFTISKRRMGT